MDGINLDEFLRANESRIRWHVESLVRERAAQAVGRENLGKVILTLWGDTLDDLAVQVEGPHDLKTKIEEAFRNTSEGAAGPYSSCRPPWMRLNPESNDVRTFTPPIEIVVKEEKRLPHSLNEVAL